MIPCGENFIATDGSRHVCSLRQGHTGPHRYTAEFSGHEWVEDKG